MNTPTYDEYALDKKINKEHISIGVGLNAVDNLTPSAYFYDALQSSSTYNELEDKLLRYHSLQPHSSLEEKEKECDLVSQRIARLIDEQSFLLSPIALKRIHREIFDGIFTQELKEYVGVFRRVNITKNEEILGGNASVTYADHKDIEELLVYDFEQEKHKSYAQLSDDEKILSIAKFVSNIWEIHPFREGNTRSIAVFTIQYLNKMGFEANNDIFKEHSIYFRNALVLANYANIPKGIGTDFSYLQSFFEKFISHKQLDLKPISPIS